LSRAVVPPQAGEGGVLRLQLVEGYIADVEVIGPAREAVAQRLQAVRRDQPLRMETLDRALALAGDLAGVSVDRSQLEPDTDDLAAYRLVVETSQNRFDAYLYADNRGRSGG
jgi:hemolysin activation/secretion protein